MLLEGYFLTHILFRWVAYSPTRGWECACASPKNKDHNHHHWSVYLPLNLPYPGCLGWSVHNWPFSKSHTFITKTHRINAFNGCFRGATFFGESWWLWLLCPLPKIPRKFHQQFMKEFLSLWGFGKVWRFMPRVCGQNHWNEVQASWSSFPHRVKTPVPRFGKALFVDGVYSGTAPAQHIKHLS